MAKVKKSKKEKSIDIDETLVPKEEEIKKDNKKNKKDKKDKTDKTENKKDKKNKKEKKKKSILGNIIGFIVLMLILGSIIGVLFFDIFKIRTKYLDDKLVNIPILNKLVPENSDVETSPSLNTKELTAQIDSLKAEMLLKNTEIDDIKKKNDTNENEMKRLKEIEAQQIKFKEEKNNFDTMITLNDPESYKKFYESIDPVNAEKLYPKVALSADSKKQLDKYAATFKEMDPSNAALILEEMMVTDIELVTMIITNLDSKESSEILAEMKPANAAIVSKQISPK